MFRYKEYLVFIVITVSVFTTNAQVAQWRGPNRNGIFPDTLLLKEWPDAGPEVLFVIEGVGKGYSSTVATNDRIYATGNKDTIEYLSCIDFGGNMIWQKPYGPCWAKSFPEARCTPTVDGDRVYVLTGMDLLTCFNAITGEEIWHVDVHEEYQSNWDMFGVSESLLLVDDKIIVTPCGELTTVIALNKMTGELVWKSKSRHAKRSNMSPALIQHCGKKYIITSTQTHTLSVDAETGEILWDFQHNFLSENGDNTTILVNTPTYQDSCLWISNGWDVKSSMLQIAPDGKSVSVKFEDQTFDNQNHGVVLVDGFLYGSNFTGRNSGKWVCMNWKTGEITWIGDFHTKGPIISADGMLYCLDEKQGNIALAKATPKAFEMISSFKVKEGNGPFWARPAIYHGLLFVRHGDVLIAYQIKTQP